MQYNSTDLSHELRFVRDYTMGVLDHNDCRTLVYVQSESNPDQDFVSGLYETQLPIYNVQNVRAFNGPYDGVYNAKSTVEESKIYISVIRGLSDFAELLPVLRRIYFWRARDRLMVVVKESDDKIFFQLREVFDLCWRWWMVNVVFVLESGGGCIKAFTYDPFKPDYAVRVNSYDVFYNKISNLMGFKLNISMFPNILDAIPAPNGYKGRDGVMANTLMAYLNATYAFIAPNDGVDYGENHNRVNLTGAFADVAKGKTLLALNSRYLKDEFQEYVEATYPHGRDDLTCLVPIVRIKDIKQFFSNFSISVWIPFAVFTAAFVVFVICVRYVESGSVDVIRILLTAVGINLGQSSDNYFGVGYLKVTVLLYMYLSLSLNLAYQSGMTSLFTVPIKPKQINTLQDLAESDLQIFTLVRFRRMLNRSLNVQLSKKIVPKVVTIREEDQLSHINEHKHFAVVCKNHIAAYAVMQGENYQSGSQYYRIMAEKPMPSIVCYIVKYGSPLLDRLNVLIGRLIQSGINDQWRKSTLHEMTIKGNVHQNEDSSGTNKLTMTNLITIFWFLLFGWGVSFTAFIIELVFHKLQN